MKGKAIYVADWGYNRILYWPDITALTNGQSASAVFGQPNLTTCTANTGGIGQTSVFGPFDVYSDSLGYLWVSDWSNHRITINPWL